MNDYLSRLNPAERRFVIAVGLVFFLVINIFWIWPHFGDWSEYRARLEKARTNHAVRETMIQQKPKLDAEIKKLASEGGYVPPEDQAIQFLRTIQVQAAQSGVGFQGSSRTATSTNLFFMEQLQTITVIAGEQQLVDFLYNLGSGNSLIRVREISVRPADPSRQKLNATVTLVSSYQKTSKSPAAARPVPAATKPATAAVKPAGTAGVPPQRTAPARSSPAPKPNK
jgi:type II secretory pathway component PulM